MNDGSDDDRRRFEQWDAAQRDAYQLKRLNELLAAVVPANNLYREKFGSIQTTFPFNSLEPLETLPYTVKGDLIGNDTGSDLAANLSYPLDTYVRFHRTSGTRGRPLVVLDTPQDWQWWIDTWQFVLDAAEITPHDRALMAFSFGPFIGFWSAHDAVVARGALAIPGGGLSSLARLQLLRDSRATAMFCTPSYALHLAEIAAEQRVDAASLDLRVIVVAGEPGGSVPAIRQRIESAWQARVVDHAGASEIGPWGYGDTENRGIHVIESEFIAEFRTLEDDVAAGEGELSELVLTSLGRFGCPVIRYRTGDLVRPVWTRPGRNRFVFLDGGVLGRTDDMMVIRGVNIFPGSVEQILRSFPEIAEYQMRAYKQGEMDALAIDVEDQRNEPARIAEALQLRLGLKVDVRCVPAGSLPRFEAKGKRFLDER